MDAFKILIVDDVPQDIKLVIECLKDKYQITAATTGEKAIEIASKTMPDLVLMDVSMPILNGYDTCKAILRERKTNIIFLSANDTTEEILKGYAAGGIDYIIKPFHPDILHSKIEFALRKTERKQQAAKEDHHPTPEDIFRLTVDFNKKCLAIKDMQEFANSLITLCESNYLDCCVQIHSAVGIFESSSSGAVSKLEAEVLTRMLQEEGHFFTHEQGLFFTHENVALLVKNISPQNATETLKKSLANLVENTNIMLLNLDKLLAPNNDQSSHFNKSDVNFSGIFQQCEAQKNYKKDGVKIVDDVLATMESSFVDMGLTHNQEQTLLSILNAGIDKSLMHFEQGVLLDDQLENSLKELETKLKS